MDAIALLVDAGLRVVPGTVKSAVLQTDGLGSVPYALDDVAEFLCSDPRARLYWQVMSPDRQRYPHRCPHCGAAAFVGIVLVECRAGCRGG